MSRNGKQHPKRPRIELEGATASPEEAAAIAAAIEQFLRDTAPPPAPPSGPAMSPWLHAGLLEATGRGSGTWPTLHGGPGAGAPGWSP